MDILAACVRGPYYQPNSGGAGGNSFVGRKLDYRKDLCMEFGQAWTPNYIKNFMKPRTE